MVATFFQQSVGRRMNFFTKAKAIKPTVTRKRNGWNIYAQHNKEKKIIKDLVRENTRLRLANERLQTINTRLQQENDLMWKELGIKNGRC